jgi:hypothetical protein
MRALILLCGLLVACAPPTPPLCNGSAALCDRALPDVVLPATHNAMSNRAAGWIAPNQNVGLTRQLQDGIRGLLLDTHYWEGELYLCHSDCDLGSQPLDEGLGEIADFLTAHPDEVLSILFQDGISAEDTAGALAAAGLLDLVFTPGEPWPTLGEMIIDDTRLLVTAEASGPPPDWYRNAWTVFWDTGYSWPSVDAMNCDLNRGSLDNPLYLLNHWVSDPVSTQSNAVEANVADVLRARVAACEAQHGRLPTLFAVDFHDVGDLLTVVAELNDR